MTPQILKQVFKWKFLCIITIIYEITLKFSCNYICVNHLSLDAFYDKNLNKYDPQRAGHRSPSSALAPNALWVSTNTEFVGGDTVGFFCSLEYNWKVFPNFCVTLPWKKKYRLVNNHSDNLNQYTYEASIDVSPIIRSFIRIKSARDGFPLTVGEVALGDEQHSAPDTVI